MPYEYPFVNVNDPPRRLVWEKGSVIPGLNPDVWRRDACGTWMRYADHGDTTSAYGWEIDHIIPRSRGGQTILSNLQPLHWRTNRHKGDDLYWECPTSSYGSVGLIR